MKLGRVANRFNKTPCVDAYTGALAFMCQLAPYDDSRRDSAAVERRIISVGSEAVVPARRVVQTPEGRFVIGSDHPDTFNGNLVRRSLVAHAAPYPVSIRTLDQVCLDQPGVVAFGNMAWQKNHAFTSQTSALVPEYDIYLAFGEPAQPGTVLQVGQNLFFVRAVEGGASGILCVTSEQMSQGALADATVGVSAYDKLLGRSTVTNTDTKALRVRWQALYQYGNKLAPSYGPDEQVLILAKSAVPNLTVGSTVTIGQETWAISALEHQLDPVWVCRVVRHA